MLEGRGADLFMIETFYDLEELVDAIGAVRSVSSLPIVALMTFDDGAETLAGVHAREAAERLRTLDVAAIGANHGSGLLAALEALEQMRSDGLPLAALPNIGLASLSGGRVIYPHAAPEYFAEFAAHARKLGARVIGGCCGTTPTEIAAIRAAVEEAREPRSQLEFSERELVEALGEEQRETALARALREGEFVVSVQLDPPLGGSARGLLEVARELSEGGVRFVDVNDNATARAGHELADGLGANRARDRPRDGSPSDDPRLDGAGARVDAARRARRRRPERARDHGRPAGGRRLSGFTGRLGDRRDRAGAADHAAESRRGLQRAADRRADLVLRRVLPSTRRPTISRRRRSGSAARSTRERSTR